jgi:Protein of unknown function (DUF2778)
MAWIYEIATGRLYDAAGAIAATGYSGDPSHKNDPQSVSLHDQGPIPPGRYEINPPVETVTHGPFVLPLAPDVGNQMFGRSGFLMHGDSIVAPGTASEGCVIMPRTIRELVWASGDRELHVMARLPDGVLPVPA